MDKHFTFTTENFKVTASGVSSDERTNRWDVTCLCCDKQFSPPTTMMRYQTVQCPKCQKEECLDYNDGKGYSSVIVPLNIKGSNINISF